jgi:hypothetical protein
LSPIRSCEFTDSTLRDYLDGLQIGVKGDPEVRAACVAAGYLDESDRFTEAGFDFLWQKNAEMSAKGGKF